MKKITIFLTCAFISFHFFASQINAQALIQNDKINNLTEDINKTVGFTSIGLGQIVANIIQVALSFLAIIFLGLAITAGFKWMTAGGNDDQIKKSQATLKNAIIGLIVVLAAYAITYFIFNSLPFNLGGRGGGQAVAG